MIEVIRQKDELNREVWQFVFFERYIGSDPRIKLRTYTIEKKQTRRHKWTISSLYDIYNRRKSVLEPKDVPLPDDVRQEALEAFIKTVKVIKEDEVIKST